MCVCVSPGPWGSGVMWSWWYSTLKVSSDHYSVMLMMMSPSHTHTTDTYTSGHSVSKEQLRRVVEPFLAASGWPADEDVKRAFRVFDSEGLGFIKVTLLKRFLVQAQLGVEDAICEYILYHT